eukprot:6973341-Pyramimonas_sp.AAC.1
MQLLKSVRTLDGKLLAGAPRRRHVLKRAWYRFALGLGLGLRSLAVTVRVSLGSGRAIKGPRPLQRPPLGETHIKT